MTVKDKSKQVAVQPSPPSFDKFAVGRYDVARFSDKPFDSYEDGYKCAISAFRRESSVILDFDRPIYLYYGTFRQEAIKTYIIKVLLFVGTSPTGSGLAVLARLTEILVLHPELTLEYVIDDFAKTHAATVDAVSHIIDKYFNIYDNYFYERVVYLTESHPMTAKDVLCDLSVYIRAKYYCEMRL